jgi:hypothetical protein
VLTQYVRHNDNKFDYNSEGITHRKHIIVDNIRYIHVFSFSGPSVKALELANIALFPTDIERVSGNSDLSNQYVYTRYLRRL